MNPFTQMPIKISHFKQLDMACIVFKSAFFLRFLSQVLLCGLTNKYLLFIKTLQCIATNNSNICKIMSLVKGEFHLFMIYKLLAWPRHNVYV
jgi:hypothetical protein